MYILNQIHCCPKCGASNVEESRAENTLVCECGNIFNMGDADLKETVDSTPIKQV